MNDEPEPSGTISKLKTIVIIVVGTATIVSAAWGFFFTKMKELKNERIAILDSRQHMPASPRLLSRAGELELAKALREIKGHKVYIQFQAESPGGEQLAQQLRNVFEEAKWTHCHPIEGANGV